MTNRVSLSALKQGYQRVILILSEKITQHWCMRDPIFPLHKWFLPVSLWHGIRQHCNAFPRLVFLQDMFRKIHPSDRRI